MGAKGVNLLSLPPPAPIPFPADDGKMGFVLTLSKEEVWENYLRWRALACPPDTIVDSAISWIPRRELAAAFSGVLFLGEAIHIERGVLLAPGVVIDATDPKGCGGFIEISGHTVLARGTKVKGHAQIKESRVKAGATLQGKIYIENSEIGPRGVLSGEGIVVYRSQISGNISGQFISVIEAVVTQGASIFGSRITLSPGSRLTYAVQGHDLDFGTKVVTVPLSNDNGERAQEVPEKKERAAPSLSLAELPHPK